MKLKTRMAPAAIVVGCMYSGHSLAADVNLVHVSEQLIKSNLTSENKQDRMVLKQIKAEISRIDISDKKKALSGVKNAKTKGQLQPSITPNSDLASVDKISALMEQIKSQHPQSDMQAYNGKLQSLKQAMKNPRDSSKMQTKLNSASNEQDEATANQKRQLLQSFLNPSIKKKRASVPPSKVPLKAKSEAQLSAEEEKILSKLVKSDAQLPAYAK